MTAQVFVKLSAKLAAEQGGIDSSEEELEAKNSTYNPLSTQGVIQKLPDIFQSRLARWCVDLSPYPSLRAPLPEA
jgi:hypothetical protein